MTQPEGKRFRHVFSVSDASGKTCLNVVSAALTQFKTTDISLETIPNVRTKKRVEQIVRNAADIEGIIVFTVVSPVLRRHIIEQGRAHGVPTVDILGPLLTRFSDLLEISPMAKPGLFRQLDNEYFKRIEAVDFTIKHDDSLGLTSLQEAEIVLVGLSRTAKTPTSIYLANRGWKVANIPIVPNKKIPDKLMKIDQRRIVAMNMNPKQLYLIRMKRELKISHLRLKKYSDLTDIKQEVIRSLQLYHQYHWPVVNVTHKSIEECATEVMQIIYSRVGDKKGEIS